VPEEKSRLGDEIGSKEQKMKQMHQLQPTVALADKLRNAEIPAMKHELEKLVENYKKLKGDLNEVCI